VRFRSWGQGATPLQGTLFFWNKKNGVTCYTIAIFLHLNKWIRKERI